MPQCENMEQLQELIKKYHKLYFEMADSDDEGNEILSINEVLGIGKCFDNDAMWEDIHTYQIRCIFEDTDFEYLIFHKGDYSQEVLDAYLLMKKLTTE